MGRDRSFFSSVRVCSRTEQPAVPDTAVIFSPHIIFSGIPMDQSRVDHALNELKSARERLANLEQDQVALAERLAEARRAQRRIGYYLFGLVVLFGLVMAGAFTLLM